MCRREVLSPNRAQCSAVRFHTGWSSSAGVSSRVARMRGAIAASAAKAGKKFPMMLLKDSGKNDNSMPFPLRVAKMASYRWKRRLK
jgi:hypothetical protein